MEENREATNIRDGEVVEVKEEEVLEVEQAPLLYSQASDRYHHIQRNKSLNQTSVVEQAGFFWQEKPSFSDAIANENFDVPRLVSRAHTEWTHLISNIPRIRQKKRIYNKKRMESA